ncbi:ribosomal RNA processing protein 1 homolog [Planococcus citri]|uniref:ribosomal RNA processing protein 1 homolog n=1 Tax=Planococcus citri TaxID=170843 RepID=UPI0031F7F1CA
MAPMSEYNDKLEILTDEVALCKLLTSNDLKVRKRGISSLRKWFRKLGSKKGVEEDDFVRIWNGLFYYFWMSDKPLVQEEAAECISSMMHNLENYEAVMYYIRGFFNSLVKQWDRISHYRIDKFLMLVRRFVRQILILLKNHEWDIEKLEMFSKELYTAIQILPYSSAIHLNEIFNEEVAKISKGKIPTDALVVLYKGYFECIANLRPTMQIVNSIQANIFGGLVRQLKLYIKQKALTGDCDNETNNEKTGSDDEEVNTSALDPRPGGVDVFLPYIEFDEHVVIKFIEQYTSKPGIPTKAKNILNQIIPMFASISKLRSSVTDTDKLIREMTENPKRKKPKQTLTKLIKESCRKLEEDDENEAEHEERVLKKLRNMTDLIQIPAGKSTFTVVQAKPNVKETTKRSSVSNDWTVTETAEKPSPPKKARISGNSENWIVEVTTPKTDVKSIDKPMKKSPVTKSPVTSVSDSENGIADSVSNVEQSELINKNDESDIRLVIEENSGDELASTHEDEHNNDDQVTSTIEKEETESNQNDETSCDSEINDEKKSNDEPSKKSLSVSFSDKPIMQLYEENDVKDQASDTETEIIVPASVVKSHGKLMKKDRDYVVVDFRSEANEEEEMSQELEVPREPENPLQSEADDEEVSQDLQVPRKPEKVTRTLRSRKVESTPVPVSTPDSKRTRKPREKIAEPARKSSRIAEKQKKVLFKLEDNMYQDVRSYQKVLKSKPGIPFNSSNIPTSGILKPFAVTTPINPFYFPNGERKLKRKRK